MLQKNWLCFSLVVFSVCLFGCKPNEPEVYQKEFYTYEGKTFLKPRPSGAVKCPELPEGEEYLQHALLYLSGRTFKIPFSERFYAAPPYDVNVDGVGSGGCAVEGDPPFLTVNISKDVPKSGYLLSWDPARSHSHIGFINIGTDSAFIRDHYERNMEKPNIKTITQEVLEEDIDFKSLEVIDGFYKYPFHEFRWLLIPIDETFVTPSGNLFTFVCGRGKCSTRFVYKGEIQIRVRNLPENIVPRSRLREYTEIVLNYLEEIDVTEEIKGEK